MLYEDTQARAQLALGVDSSLNQTNVDHHFKTTNPDDSHKPPTYTHEIFKAAAIQWLIETNQIS